VLAPGRDRPRVAVRLLLTVSLDDQRRGMVPQSTHGMEEIINMRNNFRKSRSSSWNAPPPQEVAIQS